MSTLNLFYELPKIRKKSRILMHYTDVGEDHFGQPILANMECGKCGYKIGWLPFETPTEVKRGVPCPKCN